ncbi:MAG: hypothetical protein ABW200_14355, partial [Hyphomicrobiaceae bacterium]
DGREQGQEAARRRWLRLDVVSHGATVAQEARGYTSCIREVAKQNRRPAHRTAADKLFVSGHIARYAT